jgi:hypothetical protein
MQKLTASPGKIQSRCYQPASDANAVTNFSPGPTNSDHQYIVALGDGRVLGVQDNEFELKTILQRNMHIYPGK